MFQPGRSMGMGERTHRTQWGVTLSPRPLREAFPDCPVEFRDCLPSKTPHPFPLLPFLCRFYYSLTCYMCCLLVYDLSPSLWLKLQELRGHCFQCLALSGYSINMYLLNECMNEWIHWLSLSRNHLWLLAAHRSLNSSSVEHLKLW